VRQVSLFFWADLSYGLQQIQGINTGNVAYWCHIGGALAGILIAYRMNLEKDAVQERRLDTARKILNGKNWMDLSDVSVGEAAVRTFLQDNPENVEALLLLSRQISRHRQPDEGKDLYQQAIRLLLRTDLDQAVEVYKEYFYKYQRPLQPELQIRLAALVERRGDLDFATRSLEMLLEKSELSLEQEGRCLFHCARLCRKMGFDDAAEMYQQRMPQSA
jgi:Tfp pilus assembly protein PilF